MAHLTRLSLRIGRSILPITSAPLLTTHLRQQPNRYSRRQSPSTITNPHRTYHSAFHPRLPEHEYTNSQTAILTASLPHIPTHGFTAKALTLGARDAGFLDVSVQLLPRGEFDLILFWLASRRGLLRGRVEEGGLFAGNGAGKNRAEMSTEQKVRLLILERLRMNEVVRGVWEDALAQMSLPKNIPLSLSELGALSSEILSLAGDVSVDSKWYSRRLAVAAIYASAEVVMTRDNSPDMRETAAFVDRRFEDQKVLTEKFTAVGQCMSLGWGTAVGVARSWGLRM